MYCKVGQEPVTGELKRFGSEPTILIFLHAHNIKLASKYLILMHIHYHYDRGQLMQKITTGQSAQK